MHSFKGVVERGHGVASGRSSESPYPAGTIKMRSPFSLLLESILNIAGLAPSI